MTEAELRAFVLGWCDGRIFSDRHMHPDQVKQLIHVVFMPLAFLKPEDAKTMAAQAPALIWEWRDQAVGGRAINGYPFFGSLRLMGQEDWERARTAIEAEQKRRAEIKV